MTGAGWGGPPQPPVQPYGWPQAFGWPQAYGWPQPYGGGWPAPPAPKPPPHDTPQPYLHVMRARSWHWWRPLLGLLVLAVGYGIAAIVGVLVATLALLPTGTGWLAELGGENLTDPRVLLITNVSLVVAIPVVWLVWVAAHQMGIGWSSSVLGRLRGRLLVPWTGLSLATLGVAILLSVAVELAGGGGGEGATPHFGWLVVVVLLTTPLQSAAEEYVFRGYLSQAIAGWFRREPVGAVVAGLVSATLFSLAHVPPDFLTFLDRFAVGLAASAVVWLTGGLEAAICLHAVNNVLVFLLSGAVGDGVGNGGASGEQWWDFLLTVAALAAYVLLVARFRRRLRPETRTAALDLRPRAPAWHYPQQWGQPQWRPAVWQQQEWPIAPSDADDWRRPTPPGHGDTGVVGTPTDPSGMVSSWRREASHDPWGMG